MTVFEPEWLLRILCAVIVGTIVGYERAGKSKPAGVRTHAIVALGACVLMIIGKYGFFDVEKADAARIPAAVVSGLGFLGGGIIFIQKGSVRGLTTAAGIWTTAALGMCFGSGLYLLGAAGALSLMLVQLYSRSFHRRKARSIMTVLIHIAKDATIYEINDCLESMHFEHFENHVLKGNDDGWYVETEISTHRDISPSSVVEQLLKNDKILDVKVK